MHMKRLIMPKTWPLERKEQPYITVPKPGRHQRDMGMSIAMVLRDILHVTRTAREAQKLLHTKQIHVNGVPRTDYQFPVGLFDIIHIGDEHYRLQLTPAGVFTAVRVDTKQASHVYSKITGKCITKGGKIQLHLSEGSTLFVDPKAKYHVGDTVVVQQGKIAEALQFEKGCLVYLTGGRYVGNVGTLEEVKHFTGGEDDRIVITVHAQKGHAHGQKIETLKEYAFVVDKGFIATL